MIYALLMAAGILEFIFALLLGLEFFDMEAEKEAEYQEGYADGFVDGKSDQLALELNRTDDEANCWLEWMVICDETKLPDIQSLSQGHPDR